MEFLNFIYNDFISVLDFDFVRLVSSVCEHCTHAASLDARRRVNGAPLDELARNVVGRVDGFAASVVVDVVARAATENCRPGNEAFVVVVVFVTYLLSACVLFSC